MTVSCTLYNLRQVTGPELETILDDLLPFYSACYPHASRDVLRHALHDPQAALDLLRVHRDEQGRVVGLDVLVLLRDIPVGGERWAAFRKETLVAPGYRGQLALSGDLAREAIRFRLAHPLAPVVLFGATTLPGYHNVVRNTHRAFPTPWRPTPPRLQAVMVELGRRCYGDEALPTEHPLVVEQPAWAAVPEEQAEWLRTHSDFHPELSAFYLQQTGGRPDRFVLVLVPGAWDNVVLSVLDDGWKRARRAWRRLTRGRGLARPEARAPQPPPTRQDATPSPVVASPPPSPGLVGE